MLVVAGVNFIAHPKREGAFLILMVAALGLIFYRSVVSQIAEADSVAVAFIRNALLSTNRSER